MAKGSDPTDSIVTVVNHHHNALVLLLFQNPKTKNKTQTEMMTLHNIYMIITRPPLPPSQSILMAERSSGAWRTNDE